MDATHVDPSGLDGVPPEAPSAAGTPIDYIIVGSGPGGAPLACRLAQAGMTVLVLEAGLNSGALLPEPNNSSSENKAEDIKPEDIKAAENKNLTYHCPGLHAASTEPHEYPDAKAVPTSWGFSVQHFSGDAADKHYYPRASALGGCSAHHAMISIYGADYDWQKIAELTGDASWSPGRMRAIYERIERFRAGYYHTRLGRYWNRFLDWLNPGRDAGARRGSRGWLDVSISDPDLAIKDRQLRLMTATIARELELSTPAKLLRWLRRLANGSLYRDFDLNDAERMRENPEGVALVPVAVSPTKVRRGPREFLLETRRDLLAGWKSLEPEPDPAGPKKRKPAPPLLGRLYIATGIFVHRLVFETNAADQAPRVIGVEFQRGRHIYRASEPKTNEPADADERAGTKICYCRREVIVSCGAFNSPQLLMLSGIGDRDHLAQRDIPGIASGSKEPPRYVHLPGVGENLMDRCEISVISAMRESFSLLDDTKFRPDAAAADDPKLAHWKAEGANPKRQGVYTSNGAVLAILKRSHPKVIQPDLFILGFPAAFRGYYRGWSKDLFHVSKGDPNGKPSRNLWSWVVLKAYTKNRGQVRLRSTNPLAPPEINFHYFPDSPVGKDDLKARDDPDPDLKAIARAVAFIRNLNAGAKKIVEREIQPGTHLENDSAGLRKWIMEEAWGHHACGTCRIGSDPWQSDPSRLLDRHAVVDSRFRVHGVRGLRVVDASVFPSIPGYFIVVPIYMLSEKAADTILNELSN